MEIKILEYLRSYWRTIRYLKTFHFEVHSRQSLLSKNWHCLKTIRLVLIIYRLS